MMARKLTSMKWVLIGRWLQAGKAYKFTRWQAGKRLTSMSWAGKRGCLLEKI
jgi:hypothetical protein